MATSEASGTERGIGAACDCESGFREHLSVSPTSEGTVLEAEENKCLSSLTLAVSAGLCPYLQYKINKEFLECCEMPC